MSNKSVLVIHPFQQHSFKTAIAVKSAGALQKYITTVYNKKGSWTNRFQFLLSKENRSRSDKRKTDALQDSEILQFCEIRALVLLILQRIDKKKNIYGWYFRRLIKVFNAKVYRYIAREKPHAIIVYDTLSADLMERIVRNKLDVRIILDMSAPYYSFMESEFMKDLEKHPEYADDMKSMMESGLYSYRRHYSKVEIRSADAFLAASDFTRKTLELSGVSKPVYLCEYGIDDFIDITREYKERAQKTELPIKILYVGRVNQAKGAYLLIDAARHFNAEQAVFDFYGNYDADKPIIQNAPENCTFHGHVPRQAMQKAYESSDVLILPTLADGYGFVIPEALSNGVPVICSRNAGASQLIKENKNGCLFDAGDKEEVIHILERIVNEPTCIDEMRKNAFASVKSLSWNRYNEQIRWALNEIFGDVSDQKR